MTITGFWAEPPLCRHKTRLFTPTLDAMIPEDDPVRLVDKVLDGVDWTPWEAKFTGKRRGQPPIHPRFVAAAILFGLVRGIRSSGKVEDACSAWAKWLSTARASKPTTAATTLAPPKRWKKS